MKITVELWAGHAVEVEVLGDIIVTLNGTELAPEMAQWAIDYGFRQGIRDAAANGKTDAERNALADKRVHAIVTNTMRRGSGGGKVTDPLQREVIALATAEVRTATENPKNADWVARTRAAKKLSLSDLRAEMLKPYIEKHKERLEAEAKAAIAKREADTVELDIAI